MPCIRIMLISLLVLSVYFPLAGNARADDTDQQEVIGEVVLVKGNVTANSGQHMSKDLGAGSPVHLGDLVETGRLSFVVIHFADGGKITLQPNSKIDLQAFSDVPGKEKQTFELLKGSLRVITGAIGKRKPQSVSYLARSISVGIRGTKFAMRLCNIGATSCRFDRGINAEGKIVANHDQSVIVKLFLSERGGNDRRPISRENLAQYLTDSYVWVSQGKIRVNTGSYSIDMEAGIDCRDRPPPPPGSKPDPNDPCAKKGPKPPPPPRKK